MYSNFRFTPTHFLDKGFRLYGDLSLGAVASKLNAETLLNTSNNTRYDFHAYGRLGIACAFVGKKGRGCALSLYAESFTPVFAERNIEYKIQPFGFGMGIAWLF